jgi:hypothetical protein
MAELSVQLQVQVVVVILAMRYAKLAKVPKVGTKVTDLADGARHRANKQASQGTTIPMKVRHPGKKRKLPTLNHERGITQNEEFFARKTKRMTS